VVEAFRRVSPEEWDELRRQPWGASGGGPEVQKDDVSAPAAPEVNGRPESGRLGEFTLQLT